MERFENGSDMSGFRSLNNSTSKRVLNLLEPVKLTAWKVMIERVTIVKFRVNYGGGSDIRSESCFLPTLPAFDAPVSGLPSEYRDPVWHGKTRMAWLPDGEISSKISLFVLTQLTNVTDTRTRRHRITA